MTGITPNNNVTTWRGREWRRNDSANRGAEYQQCDICRNEQTIRRSLRLAGMLGIQILDAMDSGTSLRPIGVSAVVQVDSMPE